MPLPSCFVIGDSISIQYGPALERMLAGRFAYARKSGEEEALRDLDHPVGANGGDSSRVLEYLRALQAGGGFAPDVLLLNCGLHDIKTDPATGEKQVPLDAYTANLHACAGVLRALGIFTVWVRTTPVDDEQHNTRAEFHRHAADVAAYNDAADRVWTEAGAPLLDLHAFTAALGGTEIFCDHVHFTEPVRELQAACIAGYLDALAATGRFSKR
ncbi:MAG: SGNH/GDSL hydrolase family protein [Planctomycetota bacterium]